MVSARKFIPSSHWRDIQEHISGIKQVWVWGLFHGMALPEPQVCLRTRCADAADGLANRAHTYVTLKVCERNSVQARRELEVYQHLNTITTRHSGSRLVRTLLDAFEITGSEGNYQCLVHKPLGMRLSDLQARCPSQRLPEHLLKLTLIHILLMLDFLHTEAQVVHTGNGISLFSF